MIEFRFNAFLDENPSEFITEKTLNWTSFRGFENRSRYFNSLS